MSTLDESSLVLEGLKPVRSPLASMTPAYKLQETIVNTAISDWGGDNAD